MSNFVEPNDEMYSLGSLYPELNSFGEEFVTRLEQLLPDSFLFTDLDIESEQRQKNLSFLTAVLSGYTGYTLDPVFDLYFSICPDVEKLYYRDQENILNRLDWSMIFDSLQFYRFLSNPENSLFFRQLFTSRYNTRLIRFLSDMDFRARYQYMDKIEHHSGNQQPFFSGEILFRLEKVKYSLDDFSLDNYWIFDLPVDERNYILSLASPNSHITELPQELLFSESKEHHKILPYITEERKSILEQLYGEFDAEEIVCDIYDFLKFTDEKEDWFAGPQENIFLPTPKSYQYHVYDKDDFSGSVWNETFNDNAKKTLLTYVVSSVSDQFKPTTFCTDLLLDLFKNDYSKWLQLDYLFSKDEKDSVQRKTLMEVILGTAWTSNFIKMFKSEIKSIKVNFFEDRPEILDSFLEQLLEKLSINKDPDKNILFLFLMNTLYCGPLSNGPNDPWDSRRKRSLFSRFFYTIFKSENPEDFLDFTNFFNIKINGFERDVIYFWYDWFINVSSEKLCSNEEKTDPLLLKTFKHYLPMPRDLKPEQILNPDYFEVFKPILGQIFLSFKEIANDTDGFLSSLISMILMMNQYEPYLEYINENRERFSHENSWIPFLISNHHYFKKDFILENLIEHHFFEYFSIEDAHFKDISEADITSYLFSKMDSFKISPRETGILFHKIDHLFYTPTDESDDLSRYYKKGLLNDTGIIFLNKLINVINKTPSDFHKYSSVLWHSLIALTDINSIPDELQSQIKAVATNQLIFLRKIVRGMEKNPVDKDIIQSCLQAGGILEMIDGKSKVLTNVLTTFRHIPECTLVSNLDCRESGNFSNYSGITIFIHNLLDRNHNNQGISLRKDFTEFLVAKLKPVKKKNPDRLITQDPNIPDDFSDGWTDDYVEPNPVWRYAYVRAIKDLGIHSRGKGHYYYPLLSKIGENDPSTKVREAAKETAETLNNLRNGHTKGSDKRHLLQAWWWIRQAHVISTGGVPDQEGAKKTRVKEIRN